jgi:hypothetical protein
MTQADHKQTDPLFDVEILHRHIHSEWLKSAIIETMKKHEAGEKTHFYDTVPDPSDLGTDVALREAIPHAANHEELRAKIEAILVDIRETGHLKPIVHGAGRGIRAVEAWNKFVEQGMDALERHEVSSLLNTPLPSAIGGGIFMSSLRKIGDLRADRGFDRRTGFKGIKQRSEKQQSIPLEPGMIDEVVAAGVRGMEDAVSREGSDMHRAESVTCAKTDQILSWATGHLLDPILGKWEMKEVDGKENMIFSPAEDYEARKPLRHVPVKFPSGTILMADWFRIPGFNEGVRGGIEEDYSGPSINSDLGVDLRTQDHFERLGLMRVHATNSYPAVCRDADMIRVGRYDEDHDYLWKEDPDDPMNMIMRQDRVAEVDTIGRVCCDLWDINFADREVLADILVEGARILAENGNLDSFGDKVKTAPATREEALSLLDKYVEDNSVTRIDVAPGETLHLYMATGRDVGNFDLYFSSPDVQVRPYLEDMFILSSTELQIDPALVDEPDWAQGGRVQPEEDPSCGF